MKVLESANIKLASVAADVFGTSGRLMLRALMEGTTNVQEIAELAKKKVRSKIPQLELALVSKGLCLCIVIGVVLTTVPNGLAQELSGTVAQ